MLACCIKHEEPPRTTRRVRKTGQIWIGKLDFFMSVMGFNIGLGNLLRFPYLCMKNGGGAFLVPYFLFLFIIGIPMFMMEMALAQYSGMTPLQFYGCLSPMLKGIGWCNVIACAIYNLYYNVIMAWIIFYFAMSFRNPLPWSACNNQWNTKNCATSPMIGQNRSNVSCNNLILLTTSPAEEFWERYALRLSTGIGHLDNLNWVLVGCLCIAWVFVFLCLIRGIKTMGKVVYVTALTPYMFLIVLLIRGLLLSGSKDGIIFYLYPRMSFLLKPAVWMEAGQQIFWSLAPGWGITISLASHNSFFHNIYRDAIMLPLVSCFTSFLGGFVIFSFIGHIAAVYGVPINCIFKVGPGLAFNVYPQALQLLPFSQLWCILFFALLFVLGLDSSFTSFETVYDSLKDEYSEKISYPMVMKVVLIFVSFVVSLPLVTYGGFYLFMLVDYYQIALFPLLALVEVILVVYIYGIGNLKSNIHTMTGYKIGIVFAVVWKILLPATLLCLFVFTVATQSWLTYGDYEYPVAAIVCGWIISAVGVLPIPVYFVYKLVLIKIDDSNLAEMLPIVGRRVR